VWAAPPGTWNTLPAGAGIAEIERELAFEHAVGLGGGVAMQARRPAAGRHGDVEGEQLSAGLRGGQPDRDLLAADRDDVARRARMTKQSMTELVTHLEARGYVERVDDPSDRRSRPVRATGRGLEVYAVVREFVAELDAELTAALGAHRISELRTLLADLQAALREA
jgi:DNA-binding MarR family transcriptional regulator